MRENNLTKKGNNQKNMETILKLAISTSLGSLGIVISTIVVFLPNVEFISVSIFLISILFGVYYGLISAISISIVYEFVASAIFSASIVVFIFKLVCYIGLALISGLGRKVFLRLSFWELGVFGSIFALVYDAITTIGLTLYYRELYTTESRSLFLTILSVFAAGAIITTIHIIGNFVLFSLTKTIIGWIKSAFQARGIRLIMLPSTGNELSKSFDHTPKGGTK